MFKIYPVNAKIIIEVIELYEKYKKTGKELDKTSISKALGLSEVTIQNSIGAMKQLKLDDISDIIENSNKEKQKILFREALQSYKPFLEFLYFLEKGEDPSKAIQKIIEIFNIKRRIKDVKWTFQNWGVYANIFKKNSKFELNESIKNLIPNKLAELVNLLDNEIKIKIWVKKILGEAENYLSNNDYKTLLKSILNIEKDPRNAILHSSEVLEDFLRKIAKDKEIDVSKRNGISEIAEELRKNKIIASKHIGILKGIKVFLDRDVFDGFASFRNMAHHGLDKNEMKKWELSEELAFSYIIQVLLCIKSIYYYVIKNQLKF